MDAASAAGNLPALQRLSRNYALVSSDGLSDHLARAKGSKTKAAPSKFETMVRKDSELRHRLEALLAKSPDASRKEIHQALKAAGKNRQKAPHVDRSDSIPTD